MSLHLLHKLGHNYFWHSLRIEGKSVLARDSCLFMGLPSPDGILFSLNVAPIREPFVIPSVNSNHDQKDTTSLP
jgi:hypothetical protein